MKRNIFFTIVLLMIFLSTTSQEKQDSLKVNPIIFADVNLGYTNGNLTGFMGGVSLNYQKKNNLFTIRAFQTHRIEKVGFVLFFIPINVDSKTIKEYSFLFGRRIIKDGFSYHFSGGISYNNYREVKEDIVFKNTNYFGFPFEVGVSWFKPKKSRFRILYGIIPVGKPTGFARSIGLKLYGNIAKKSYVGLGLSVGLGFHKKYN